MNTVADFTHSLHGRMPAAERSPFRPRCTSVVTCVSVLLAVLVSVHRLAAADYDLVVYGGTSAGVTAAVQDTKMGKSVVIVCPDKHLGGLSSGGLGFTDTGNKAVIGGLSREFYHRVWKHYDQPEAWLWQKKAEYGGKGQGTPAVDGSQRTMWIFEPHVAEQVFEDLVREYRIPVHRDEWLDRARGVKKDGARIVSISTLSGKTYVAKMFIDATYEGDLMAAAGVEYHVGREANSVYGETWNGVQTGVLHHRHHFGVLSQKISPYIVPVDPTSGVLPGISTASPGEHGQGDNKVQAYCYRYCVTDHPDNRMPFPKPDGYDPARYELLLRVYAAGWRETFEKFDPIPNRKTDTNNHGPVFYRQHRAELRLPRGLLRAPPDDSQGTRGLPEGLAALHCQRSTGAEGSSRRRCAAGACPKTSSRTTPAGRTRSTFARPGACAAPMS